MHVLSPTRSAVITLTLTSYSSVEHNDRRCAVVSCLRVERWIEFYFIYEYYV